MEIQFIDKYHSPDYLFPDPSAVGGQLPTKSSSNSAGNVALYIFEVFLIVASLACLALFTTLFAFCMTDTYCVMNCTKEEEKT